MKPYYRRGGITIYHGDAAQIVPSLPRVDLLLTDPPYGIGADRRQAARAGKRHGKAAAPSRDYGRSDWDRAVPPSWLLGMMIDFGDRSIVWGGNYFSLPPARGWLVWDKDNGRNTYADCELAWTNLDQAVRRLKWRWMGMLQEPGYPKEARVHPTQKPLALMRWCVEQAGAVNTVLDPFMGSGTTLVAARTMRRKAVGIEIDERYCELAAMRLEALYGFRVRAA